jgi:hypothetical protein
MAYLRCRNCGRYLLSVDMINQGYCSDECVEVFRACTNCGDYFRADMVYGEQYCRPDCAIQYKMSRFVDTTTTDRLAEELA